MKESIIHSSNPNILAFLPPANELPELIIDPDVQKGDLNLTTELFEKIKREQRDLDKTAIEFDSSHLSFRQFFERTYSIANFLFSRGIAGGDRVLVLLDFCSSALEVLLGVFLTGAIACQDIPHVTERVQNHVKVLAPKYVFIDSNVTEVSIVLESAKDTIVVIANPKSDLHSGNERILYLEDLLAAPTTFSPSLTKGGTIATMFHTSGSTGMPKGCVATHATWTQGLAGTAQDPHPFSTFEKGDKFYYVPPTNAFSFYCVVAALYLGGTLVISNKKDITDVIVSLSKGVTWMVSTPPFYNRLRSAIDENPAKWGKSAGSLKVCVSGGESHTSDFASKWKASSGVDLINFYGSTEGLGTFGYNTKKMVPGAMGSPLSKVQVEILDENYNTLPINTPGLLSFKSTSGCIYWNNQEKQSYYVRNGWNIPRDICKKGKDGNIWFVGREDDLIITKSSGNVSAIEIEGIVQADSRVKEVAVVGKRAVENREDGKLTVITAFVVTSLNEGERNTLRQELQFSVERHSEFTLDEIEFIDVLPKLPNGKINRKALK